MHIFIVLKWGRNHESWTANTLLLTTGCFRFIRNKARSNLFLKSQPEYTSHANPTLNDRFIKTMHLSSYHRAGPVDWGRGKTVCSHLQTRTPLEVKVIIQLHHSLLQATPLNPLTFSLQILHTTLHSTQKLDWKQFRSWAVLNTKIGLYPLCQTIVIVAESSLSLRHSFCFVINWLVNHNGSFCHTCKNEGILNLICVSWAFLPKETSSLFIPFCLLLTMPHKLQKSVTLEANFQDYPQAWDLFLSIASFWICIKILENNGPWVTPERTPLAWSRFTSNHSSDRLCV